MKLQIFPKASYSKPAQHKGDQISSLETMQRAQILSDKLLVTVVACSNVLRFIGRSYRLVINRCVTRL